MHIAILLDQHPRSLGGAQASVNLQAKFLRRAGHRVTIVAPAGKYGAEPGVLVYKSHKLTPDGEYHFTFNLWSAGRSIRSQFDAMDEPLDLVHVQGDQWSAALGVELARQLGLPLVQTMHTNIQMGVEKVLGKFGARALIYMESLLWRWYTKAPARSITSDGWKYQAQLVSAADAVIAPTGHFAELSKANGVRGDIQVIATGVDDDFLTEHPELQNRVSRRAGQPVQILWCGRMSPEKRPVEFAQALAKLNGEFRATIYGDGQLLGEVKNVISSNPALAGRVSYVGRVSHHEMLAAIAGADLLAQTSAGFETQGMTVYEAGVLGTPPLLCDSAIAADLPTDTYWLTRDESVEALVEALQTAVDDISTGRGKHIDLRERMLQSKLTEQMLGVYRRVLEAR